MGSRWSELLLRYLSHRLVKVTFSLCLCVSPSSVCRQELGVGSYRCAHFVRRAVATLRFVSHFKLTRPDPRCPCRQRFCLGRLCWYLRVSQGFAEGNCFCVWVSVWNRVSFVFHCLQRPKTSHILTACYWGQAASQGFNTWDQSTKLTRMLGHSIWLRSALSRLYLFVSHVIFHLPPPPPPSPSCLSHD